jgi:hypothetical protein
LRVGIALVAAGAVVLALIVTGVRTASTLDLAPGLFLAVQQLSSSVGVAALGTAREPAL